MHWFEKSPVLNAVGVIRYIPPRVYPYNEVVFVSMSVSIKLRWSRLVSVF